MLALVAPPAIGAVTRTISSTRVSFAAQCTVTATGIPLATRALGLALRAPEASRTQALTFACALAMLTATRLVSEGPAMAVRATYLHGLFSLGGH